MYLTVYPVGDDSLLRWGILLWYTTLGAIIGVFGVYTWNPVLKLPMPWWFLAPLLGAWMNFVSTAAGICTGAAAQKCTTGSVVACPRSPWEGPASGATRPPRGWRRPARGRGVWAHAGKRGVIRTVAGVVTGSA